jgi:predicted nucleic acid-binding protein
MTTSLRERVLVDSNVIIELLRGNEKVKKKLKELVKGHQLAINPIIFSEVAFQLIATKYVEEKGRYSAFDVKRELKKNEELLEYYRAFYTNFLLGGLMQGDLTVLEVDEETMKIANELMEKHRLLSNDALILATALKFGIRKIFTLNGDFDVGIINVIKLEEGD